VSQDQVSLMSISADDCSLTHDITNILVPAPSRIALLRGRQIPSLNKTGQPNRVEKARKYGTWA
jgi:hypothetical protein